jgi:hypothetical protein
MRHVGSCGSATTLLTIGLMVLWIPAGAFASKAMASAPPANWQSIGPFGGPVEDVAVSPMDSTLVLAALSAELNAGGLFISTNGGVSWSRVPALASIPVYDIAYNSSGTIFVATQEGVYKGTPDGMTWTQLSLGVGSYDQAFEVTVDPRNRNRVWVGLSAAGGAQTTTVLLSTNGGTTWLNKTPPAQNLSCRAIAVHPQDSNRVYASFGDTFSGGQLWVTTTGGAIWLDRSYPTPQVQQNDVVHDGTHLYLCGGVPNASQAFGFWSSTNDGVTWTQIHDENWPSLYINDIELDPQDPNHILLATEGQGVFQSTDGGADWTFGLGRTSRLILNSVRFSPWRSSRILLGASAIGVVTSNYGGVNFRQESNGIDALNVTSIASNPLNGNEVAACFSGMNDGGLFRSLDGGASWLLEDAPLTRYSRVAYSKQGLLYALSVGPVTIASEGVYRRNGDGTWTNLGPDQGIYFETDLRSIAFCADDPSLILIGGADFGVAGNEGTIWRSSDMGANWTKSYEGPIGHVVTDIAVLQDGTGQQALASAIDNQGNGGGALHTTDGGITWVDSSAGLNATAQGTSLSACTQDPHVVYYTDRTSDRLFRTANAGLNWASAGIVGGSAVAVVCDPKENEVVYAAGSSPWKCRVSEDSGQTFHQYDGGLTSSGSAISMSYWVNTTPGLPDRLYLATSKGSWVTLLDHSTDAETDPTAGDTDLLRLIGPHPLVPGVRTYLEVGPEVVELGVYDLGGRKIREVSFGAASTGGARFDLSGLLDGAKVGSGVYFVVARTARQTITRKIHFLR